MNQTQDEEYDETFVEPDAPHRPSLEDGKRYTGKITDVVFLPDQPTWNNEAKRFDTEKVVDKLEYTVDVLADGVDGVKIKFKVTKCITEKCNLYKLAKEFGFGDLSKISKTGFSGRQLVGKTARFKVVHSKPSPRNGSIFDNIEVASIEAVDTFDDDANNPNIV